MSKKGQKGDWYECTFRCICIIEGCMKLKRLCSVFLAFLMVIGNLQTSTSALENETIQVNYQSQNVSVTTDKDSALFGDSITLSGTTTLEVY